MNATKRLLTGAAIAAGALGIGAGVFFACRQELSPGAQNEAAGAERRPGDAKYDDGDYDFYFKNGAHIHGDCDGYNSEPGGKTTIYEYFQTGIKAWEKRLHEAGIKPEVYRTSKPKYCWVRFDTDLLNGVGYEGYHYDFFYQFDDEADIVANGKRILANHTDLLYYALPNTGFNKFDVPAIRISFWLKSARDDTAKALKVAGVKIKEIGTGKIELPSHPGNYDYVSGSYLIAYVAGHGIIPAVGVEVYTLPIIRRPDQFRTIPS